MLIYCFAAVTVYVLLWWLGVKLGLIHWHLRKGDWQGHSNNERACLGRWEKRGRYYLTFGIWSYLTVGLLFGLTFPGVSAHGFLRGGGWGKGLYSSKPYKSFSETDTDRERWRMKRDWSKFDRKREDQSEQRQSRDDTERLRSKKDGERRRKRTDTIDRERLGVGDRDL